MTFGTLEFIQENNEKYFEIKSEYEVELMIKRLIPSHQTYPLRVRIHPENTRILRMVMSEYPLDIKNNGWQNAIDEINKKEELKEKIQKLDYIEPDKAYFQGELFPFQKQCLDFLQKTNGNALITDEMGLGKTIESISFIATKPKMLPVIVVAPVTTIINWKREIEKFLMLENNTGQQQLTENDKRIPNIKLIRHGIRKGINHDLPSADFYLINYELVDKRLPDIVKVNPKIVIFDECQNLRNFTTKKYNACKALASLDSIQHKIGLSGTPIYNKGIEMFNICEVIKAGVLGERNEFIRRYCHEWFENKTTDESKIGLSSILKKSIMIRRKKIDVLDDLPDKVRMRQPIQIDTSMYEMEIQKLYDKIGIAKEQLTQSITELEEKEGLFELNKRIREMRIAERQIAGLAKAPHVVNYLNTLMEDYDEEKFVVFCHHISVHKILFDGLFLHNPVQIIGGQTDNQRQDAIDKFMNDKDTKVIICGLRAGNLGINLTSSAYVIFAELDWSPSIHRQAEDRLHRIGQKRNVFAHYLEGVGTFDEILSHVLLKKTVEINDALGDKLERMNNKEALKFLESKFKFDKGSKIAELLTQTQS